jgi:glycerol kinase
MVKCTYGTGCFMLMNTGATATVSNSGLVTTIAWRRQGIVDYALEGSVFVGGAVVQWLRDGLGLFQSSSDVEALAAAVADNGGVYLVPAFAGLGAPHWDPRARGILCGLTRGTTRGHVARAALESIAFQVADLAAAMEADCGVTLPELRVDGGAARNDLLMQVQADILQTSILRPRNTETTALGAAFLAGRAAGVWRDDTALAASRVLDRRFEPAIGSDRAGQLRYQWRRAVARAKDWIETDD